MQRAAAGVFLDAGVLCLPFPPFNRLRQGKCVCLCVCVQCACIHLYGAPPR